MTKIETVSHTPQHLYAQNDSRLADQQEEGKNLAGQHVVGTRIPAGTDTKEDASIRKYRGGGGMCIGGAGIFVRVRPIGGNIGVHIVCPLFAGGCGQGEGPGEWGGGMGVMP